MIQAAVAVARGVAATGPTVSAASGAVRGTAAAGPRVVGSASAGASIPGSAAGPKPGAGGASSTGARFGQLATGPTPGGPNSGEPALRAYPRARPVGPPEGLSPVSAFDRPQAVIVMGPRPLPVTFVGGLPSGPPAPKEPKEPKESSFVSRLTDGLRFAGEVATGAGQAAAGVAHNSPAAVFNGAVNTAAAGLNRLGPYGQAAAAGLQAASAGVNAFREAVGAFTSRAKEIGGYDGRIAGANAMAEVRRINSDMREANKIGDQLSKLVTAQSRTEAMWDEILLAIKGPLIELLTGGLDIANKSLIGILEATNKLSGGLVPGLDRLIKDLKKINAGDPSAELDKRIREFIEAPLGGFVAPSPAGFAGGGMPPLGMPMFN